MSGKPHVPSSAIPHQPPTMMLISGTDAGGIKTLLCECPVLRAELLRASLARLRFRPLSRVCGFVRWPSLWVLELVWVQRLVRAWRNEAARYELPRHQNVIAKHIPGAPSRDVRATGGGATVSSSGMSVKPRSGTRLWVCVHRCLGRDP